MNAGEKAAVLSRSRVFARLPLDELALFAEMLRVEQFRAGAIVCERGEPADCVFIVASGDLEVLLNAGEPPLARLGSGDVFGEYGMFTDGVRTATVRATSDAVLLSVGYERFQSFLLTRPEAIWALLRQTVDRLMEGQRRRA